MFDDVAEYYFRKMQTSPSFIKKGNTTPISDIYVAFHNEPEIQHLIDKLDQGLRLIRSEE
ncbi:hypothetical protein [Paraglaciecola sp.]|uniref:hypothetical protein n=1 Tax=Paraglaciecola sp. TaxID=1920173 RepID=UPI0030F3ABE0